MPYAYVDINPALEWALEQGLVLTSNDRLRRELIRSFDLHQQRRGLRVWPGPQVYSVQGWWQHLYQSALIDDPQLPTLLSREQAYLLFRELAPSGQQHLSNQALQAWEQVQQWQIALDDPALASTQDGRMFVAWASRFAAELDAQRQITAAQLPQLPALLDHVGVRPVFCLELENPPKHLSQWLNALGGRIRVEMLEALNLTPGQRQRSSFDTPEAELAAAARWCRQLLDAHQSAVATTDNPSSAALQPLRIGVVIPDLGSRYQSVLRQFIAEFSPLATDLGALPFDLGGGGRLVDQPVWQAAQQWLELVYRRLPVADAQRLCRSRYLRLPEVVDWPELLPEQVNLEELARILGSPALTALAPPAGQRLTFASWLARFQQSLQIAGWSADAAGSLQYQAAAQLQGLLRELPAPERGRTMDAAAALDELRGALSLRLFAPKRNPAPVQILGYLETTGLRFSHLWVAGMDEESWPAATSGNPLLAMAACRKHGLPRTTPADELTFARERLNHWLHCTDLLIASYPAHRDGHATQPSPLIAELPDAQDLLPAGRPHPFFQADPQLEPVSDSIARALPEGMKSGGIGLFTDQAGCPFRSWAIYRLDMRQPRDPHAFPDPLDRGTLFHRVMQNLYQDFLNSPHTPDRIDRQVIDRAITAGLKRHYGRFPPAFINREHQRLTRIVDAWLELEASRGPFKVTAIETDREVDIAGIRIRIRVDRIDQVDDALVIIDYKTGRITLPGAQTELLEPQLPIYALTDERIRGVFYAQLDEEKPRLAGVGSHELDMGGVRIAPPLEGSWQAQSDIWSQQLEQLAGEIRSGYAAVEPRRPGICNHCHLAGLCRIDEAREQQ